MRISLIICTRDRCDQLRVTLERARTLRSDDAWELVVVDNGSRDGTGALLEGLQATFPCPVRVVHEPAPGAGRARNAGVRAARGELVVFTDDDCYPAEDFLQVAADVLRDSGIGFACGRLLLYDQADHPVATIRRDERREVTPGDFIPAGIFSSANMALPRAVFEAVHGFDEDLGPGTPFVCEDVDLVARISAAGWRGVYDPRLLVHHHHRRKTEADAAALTRVYDVGRGAYYAKCLLNPALRGPCARYWWRSLRRAKYGRSLREIAGGAWYLARRWLRR